MPRTAWAEMGCGGWYRSKMGGEGDGGGEGTTERVTALHPGSQTHWEEMIGRVRWDDFEYKRGSGGVGGEGNRFAYLGNGFARSEVSGEE